MQDICSSGTAGRHGKLARFAL